MRLETPHNGLLGQPLCAKETMKVTRVYKDRYGSEVAPGVCKVRRRGATALACIRAPSCSTTMYSSTSIMASRSVSVPRQCRSSASEYVSACGHSLGRGISYDF